MTSLWFDDLTVGRSWSSPSRTITEADVGNFAGLTGDHFPLHTSEEYAKTTAFGTRIAHGLLGLTFAHGLMWARTGELDESVLALVGIGDWRFRGPIHFGDTIRVEYRVSGQRPVSDRTDRGIVDFAVTVLDQHGATVQQGTKTLLIARRPA
ncbi:MaoC/PaaZ C-terminal domain-containing protein [Rhodococcus sp. NPDC057297]|uniref:MaoC/PaaZ C-terminal domain-containing protein n=1 Tax=Rhodococcus sp. NPDC057297 TaxID=3346090 RepID=UPI0036440B8F